MANSWSFLYDELKMDEKRDSSQDYWYEDGFSLTGNPGAASSDTINFTGMSSAVHAADTVPMDGILGGVGQDIVTFS